MAMHRTVGLSTKLSGLNEQTFAAYRANGIDAVEVSVASEDYDRLDLHAAAVAARTCGVDTWSFHLRFMPFAVYNISLPDPAARRFAVDACAEWIKRAGAEGFRYAVIHPSGEPIFESAREAHFAAAEESLSTLAEVAAAAGIILAVENLPRTCLGRNGAEMLRLLKADARLRVCFDTNHLLGEPTLAFMDAIKEKLVTLHVSDYDFVDERHWLPGDGKVDWHALMDKLDEIGYNGVFLYETHKTLDRNGERMLTLSDYRTNAMQLEARTLKTGR